MRFLIINDLITGFYLLAFENGRRFNDLHDKAFSQPTLEKLQTVVFEKFQVPLNAWTAEVSP